MRIWSFIDGKTDNFEKFFGSLAVTAGGTLLAASSFASGSLFAPLLPVFTSSLATASQQKRLDKAINEIEALLASHQEKIDGLTDSQLQLIGDSSMVMFQTFSDDKIDLLRNSIINTVFERDIAEHESIVLSRVLRDLSCWEFKFLVSMTEHKTSLVMDEQYDKEESDPDRKRYDPGSNEDQIIRSLANYNLVKSDISGFGASLFYTITPIGERLIKLYTKPNIYA